LLFTILSPLFRGNTFAGKVYNDIYPINTFRVDSTFIYIPQKSFNSRVIASPAAQVAYVVSFYDQRVGELFTQQTRAAGDEDVMHMEDGKGKMDDVNYKGNE